MTELTRWWEFRKTELSQEWNLGLERTEEAARALGLYPEVPVITVAGTNGKGSICRFVEAIAMEQGLNVGLYSSPHLFRFNERIRLFGQSITDAHLSVAFAQVADAKNVRELTLYEFDTLAAMAAFRRQALDLIILEVGLGGRLDAVNIWDAEVAVIGTIDLDHQQWLGDTREAIAREKAGILRAGHPIICGDRDPPDSLITHALDLRAPMQKIGRDYDWQLPGHEDAEVQIGGRPVKTVGLRGLPPFQRDNLSTALAAFSALGMADTVQSLSMRTLDAAPPGRCQRVEGAIPLWFEVGHNVQAVSSLSAALIERPVTGRTHAVFAALSDKDIEGIVGVMAQRIDHWFLPDLDDPRACTRAALRERTLQGGVLAESVVSCDNVALAFEAARAQARPGDQVVVFGSFVTVAEALSCAPSGSI